MLKNKASAPLVVILAAGQGIRFGADKRFAKLDDETLLAHVLRRAKSLEPQALALVVDSPSEMAGFAEQEHNNAYFCVQGGATRSLSVKAGLEALAATHPPDARVLIHDAARPLTPPALMRAVLEAVRPGVGATPALALNDSLVESLDGDRITRSLQRATIRTVQTPQGFLLGEILAAHHAAEAKAKTETKTKAKTKALPQDITDDTSLFRQAGHRVTLVKGDPLAHKVTYPYDLQILEALWRANPASV